MGEVWFLDIEEKDTKKVKKKKIENLRNTTNDAVSQERKDNKIRLEVFVAFSSNSLDGFLARTFLNVLN